jgi:hypothetical protein
LATARRLKAASGGCAGSIRQVKARLAAAAYAGTGSKDAPVRRSTRRKSVSSGRLLRQLDRSAGQLNPLLLAIAVGLLILNVTCFITVKLIGLPHPVGAVTAAPSRPLPGEDGRY